MDAVLPQLDAAKACALPNWMLPPKLNWMRNWMLPFQLDAAVSPMLPAAMDAAKAIRLDAAKALLVISAALVHHNWMLHNWMLPNRS
jgi:hypothetical protein